MKPIFKLTSLFALLQTIIFCSGPSVSDDVTTLGNEYAKYFSITNEESGSTYLIINESWSGNGDISRYKLVPRDERGSREYSRYEIPVPLKSVVCMSTSHISYISAIGEESSVVAVSGAQYITNPKINSGLAAGMIKDIGFETSINYEMLLQLSPDVVFTYGISGENNIYIDKIRELGIKVIVVGDYMEEHPLGKLEYLNFFGTLFSKAAHSDSIFNAIKRRYNSKRELVRDITERPKVLLNAPWKDIWYIPGVNSYMSHLIKDAGGEIILSKEGDNPSNPNSLEEVYMEAENADFWLNPNFYTSLYQLETGNPLFKRLPVFVKGRVFNNTKRNTSRGGSDFWETGVIEPDVILNDLINILHPTRGDSCELKYYILLK
ncbi:MAG: iron ABC transporter substrate-binding protein [Bacteroidetes bacterium HGW-Bacteroidetes-8]|jgi:iron complex transport system substrate-binding protein|nr:MAG: iron ABC transporter substrate-binding protein [Bacteroidetes bacterium HGW-Bacteroidetes-8]